MILLIGYLIKLKGEINLNYTQKPWRVIIHENSYTIKSEECMILQVFRDPVVLDETWERQKADARLMAASPDMYEALNEVCNEICVYDCRKTEKELDCPVGVGKALRKAEGKEW